MNKFLNVITLFAVTFVMTIAAMPAMSQNKIFTKFAGAKAQLALADTTYFTVSNVGAHDAVTVQFSLSKDSGTVAGKAYLEVSNNNIDWVQVSAGDTLALTDVSRQSKVFALSAFNYRSARVKVITSGGYSKPFVTAYFIHPK